MNDYLNYHEGDVAQMVAKTVCDSLDVASPSSELANRHNVTLIAIALVNAYTAGVVAGIRRGKP